MTADDEAAARGSQGGGRLVLVVGMPGAGKTTLARELVATGGGVRLDADAWILELGQDPEDPVFRDRIERILWRHGLDLLRSGVRVVVEYGLWVREQREAKRAGARELGVPVDLHVLDVSLAERWRRIEARNREPGVVVISRTQLETWAGHWERPDRDEVAGYDTVTWHGAP